MIALVEKLTREAQTQGGNVTRIAARQAVAKPKPGRPKSYIFQYRPPAKTFNLKLKFRKSEVDRAEVIEALEGIIAELRTNQN